MGAEVYFVTAGGRNVMKWGVPISVLRRGIILAAAIIVCGLFAPAYGRAGDVMLLLEQSPVKGGEITPVAGMYHLEPGSQVSLTAVPKPGYQFLHWLGDVSDPTATSTVVHLNKPKIIVAVFEPTERILGKQVPAGGGGGGGLFPTSVNLSWPGGLSAGGAGSQTRPYAYYAVEGNEPVPEPATGVLLLMGGLLAFRRRRTRSSGRLR